MARVGNPPPLLTLLQNIQSHGKRNTSLESKYGTYICSLDNT